MERKQQVRQWILSERSWPLLLLVLVLTFWLSPQRAWVSVLFVCLTTVYVVWIVSWALEYWKIQRKSPNLLFIMANLFFSMAIGIGAFVNWPGNAGHDLSTFRTISRWCYAIGLPFLAIAVYREAWRVGKQALEAWNIWHDIDSKENEL